MELVAEAPDVRHPTVVCVAPDGRVFVAEDPMDISTPHADAQEGRILCLHPDGRRTVFAQKLHAVFGLQYLEGKLYVLHNPQFSVFTDDHGVGKDRSELIESMNPNPWALDWNDHVPANFRLAMDGYFYVAVGDKGVYGAVGRDGKRVEMRGGILRLRPDGTELEVYCTGVRNILDVALDDQDEMFTYDNTDEHDWMGRLTHMVDGGFYGYPYDFVPRRPYALWMMRDFGGGAATGTLCYNEDALPEDYHGNLFLGDFGKQQILRVRLARDGATYHVKAQEEFFQNPPTDFRPVGIAFDAEGRSLYICDWQHRDTKENVVVGRLWKAIYTGPGRPAAKPAWYLPAAMGNPCPARPTELVHALSHPSKAVRMAAQRQLARRRETGLLVELVRDSSAPACARWHALWALDAIDAGQAGRDAILAAAEDRDASVRRQAIRQLGTRQTHAAVPALLARLKDGDAGVRFQAATALGRVGDSLAVPKLLTALEERDPFARYAVFTALNRVGRKNGAAWHEIAQGLESENQAVREGTEFALRETYDNALLEVLLGMATDSKRKPETREESLRLATPLHHKTADWNGEWWAYHPALAVPPEKNTAWAGTSKIIGALRTMLDDAEPRLRLAAVNGLLVAGDVESAPRLRSRFEQEPLLEVRREIIHALGELKDAAFSASLARLLHHRPSDPATLAEVVRAAGRIGGDEAKAALLDMVAARDVDSTLRLEVMNVLGQLKAPGAVAVLEPFLSDADPSTRTAAMKAIAHAGGEEALRTLRPLLRSDSIDLRRESVAALGGLHNSNALPDLLEAWRAPETRQAALAALAQVSDLRALDAYLDGLAGGNAALREQCRKALTPIRDAALPLIEPRAATLQAVALSELRRIYKDHPQAAQGPLFAVGKRTLESADYEKHALEHAGDPIRGQRIFFDEGNVACVKCHAIAGHGGAIGPDLTLIGGQFPRRDLVEHVLEPSKVVREGYQQIVIETREGETFSGLPKGETAETLTLLDTEGRLRAIAKNTIAARLASGLSLMPEGLQSGLTLEQFADLIGFLESRRVDPRAPAPEPPPGGFVALFDGRDLDLREWREAPEGTKRVRGLERDSAGVKAGKGAEAGAAREARAPFNPDRGVPHSTAGRQPEFLPDHSVALLPASPLRLETSRAPAHWRAINGVLEHDGQAADLWTQREFGDFDLRLEWRWPDGPKWEYFPVINHDGNEDMGADGRPKTERVLDGGDSGIFLRGFVKAKANLFCHPVGSGAVWEYRTDPQLSPEMRRALTPRKQADRPVGDWNRMEIRLRADRLTVVLNGEELITQAPLPGIPARGPIGLEHKRGRIQFRNVFIKELK